MPAAFSDICFPNIIDYFRSLDPENVFRWCNITFKLLYVTFNIPRSEGISVFRKVLQWFKIQWAATLWIPPHAGALGFILHADPLHTFFSIHLYTPTLSYVPMRAYACVIACTHVSLFSLVDSTTHSCVYCETEEALRVHQQEYCVTPAVALWWSYCYELWLCIFQSILRASSEISAEVLRKNLFQFENFYVGSDGRYILN